MPNSQPCKKVGGYKPRAPGSLKDATDKLIAACGGLDRAASLVRVSRTTLARYSDPADRDAYMPVDVVRALELSCGDAIVTRFLAAEQGCDISRVRFDRDAADLAADLATLALDDAVLFGDLAQALAAGQIDRARAAKLLGEADAALGVLFHLRDHLSALRGGDA